LSVIVERLSPTFEMSFITLLPDNADVWLDFGKSASWRQLYKILSLRR
jgi:hypothetical protein